MINKSYLLIYLTFCIAIHIAETRQIEIVAPIESVENIYAYEFVPVATIVGLGVVGFCFIILTILKIMFANSDQYMGYNRYDLVIFKIPTKNSVNPACHIYSNSNANSHNIEAANASGFDLTTLNNSIKSPYTVMNSNVKIIK